MPFIPSVFVGVGGVGKNVLLRIRRMIVENYRTLDNLPSIRFLHVDTDRNPSPDGNSQVPMEVLGKFIGFTDAEQVDLSQYISREASKGGSAIKNHPCVAEWFFDDLPVDHSFRAGAGGVRPYGRLAFHYAVGEFRAKIKGAMNQAFLATNRQKTAETLKTDSAAEKSIYIICSLLGGTGSGSFLEVCYNVREALPVGEGIKPNSIGVFVVGGSVDDIRKANCYSALLELDHFMSTSQREPFRIGYPIPGAGELRSEEAPVDLCYLVGPFGARNVEFSDRNRFEEAIALNLFLEFGSSIADEKRGRRDDIVKLEEYRNLDAVTGKCMRYMSFGVAVLEFPSVRLQEMFAYELARIVVNGWLFEDARGGQDVQVDVRTFLRSAELEDLPKRLLSVGGQSLHDTVRREIATQKDQVVLLIAEGDAQRMFKTAEDHIELNVKSITFSYDPTQCGGRSSSIHENSVGVLEATAVAIEKKMHDYLENEHQGLPMAVKFLTAVSNELTVWASSYRKEFESFERSARHAEAQVQKGFEKFRHNYPDKFALNYHNSKLHEQLIQNHMTMALKREAYRAALSMLTEDGSRPDGSLRPSLVNKVKLLEQRLREYREALRDIANDCENHRAQLEESIKQTQIAEGIRLSSQKIRELMARYVRNPSKYVVPLMKAVQAGLGVRAADGSLVQEERILSAVLDQGDATRQILLQNCSDVCEDVRKISIAEELHASPKLDTIVEQAYDQAGALIQLSQSDLKPGGSMQGKVTEFVAHVQPESDRYLEKVVGAINKVHAYGQSEQTFSRRLTTLSDPYRIIFSEEIGIFPLRAVTFFKSYKDIYRRIKPRGTDRRLIGIPDLYPEGEQEKTIRRRAEETALVGRIFGFLERLQDPESEYEFIFARDVDTGKVVRVCSEWDELYETFHKEQYDKEIEKSSSAATKLEFVEGLVAKLVAKAQTRSQREDLSRKLKAHLEALEKALVGGVMNQEYQRVLGQIEGVISRRGLQPLPPKSGIAGLAVTSQPHPFQADAAVSSEHIAALRRQIEGMAARGQLNEDRIYRYNEKYTRLPRELVARLISETPGAQRDIGALLDQYRATFEDAVLDGELEQFERETLDRLSTSLALNEADVRALERSWVTSRYREEFEISIDDGNVSKFERKRLDELRQVLGMSKDDANNIESMFQFTKEE